MPQTMQAVTQERYGNADALDVRDVERPTPTEGQLLVKVIAARVDRGAWHFLTGQPYLMRRLGFGLPSTPIWVEDDVRATVEIAHQNAPLWRVPSAHFLNARNEYQEAS